MPDILCNAGGVVVSTLNGYRDLEHFRWSLEDVNDRLKSIMLSAFKNSSGCKKKYNTTYRMGAYTLALKRLVSARKIWCFPVIPVIKATLQVIYKASPYGWKPFCIF